MTPIAIGIAAVLIVLLVGLVLRSRTRPTDGVEQFQRQIDALSPAARRPVVDRVQQLDATADEDLDDDELGDDGDDTDADPAADERSDDEDDDGGSTSGHH